MDCGLYSNDESSFRQLYHSVPFSSVKKAHFENGDKVIMPQSALDRLTSVEIPYPMMFEVYKPSTEKVSHCGVLEFTAEEGFIYMPGWMMQNLHIQEEDIVQVRYSPLQKGEFVKMQPHTKDFLKILNPKEVLEATLRNFTCLTTNDTIIVPYCGKNYYVDIVEAKPASAICIINTDCEVDFALPLDCLEIGKGTVPTQTNNEAKKVPIKEDESKVKLKATPFTGVSKRIDEESFGPSSTSSASASEVKLQFTTSTGLTKRIDEESTFTSVLKCIDEKSLKPSSTLSASASEVKLNFTPFTGVPRRIDEESMSSASSTSEGLHLITDVSTTSTEERKSSFQTCRNHVTDSNRMETNTVQSMQPLKEEKPKS